MDIRNCPRCGKVFRYMGRRLCPECMASDEDQFTTVREYIRDHKGVNISAVSDATGVPADRINQYIREGRLIMDGVSVTVECMACGAEIASGRFCPTCLQKMRGDGQPKTSQTEAGQKPGARYHTAERVVRKER